MTDTKKLQDLLKSDYGQPFKDFLFNHYQQLNSLASVREYPDAEAQALELKAVKKASQLLREMLEEIMVIEQYQSNKVTGKDSLLV